MDSSETGDVELAFRALVEIDQQITGRDMSSKWLTKFKRRFGTDDLGTLRSEDRANAIEWIENRQRELSLELSRRNKRITAKQSYADIKNLIRDCQKAGRLEMDKSAIYVFLSRQVGLKSFTSLKELATNDLVRIEQFLKIHLESK